jgi:hypothetical protein
MPKQAVKLTARKVDTATDAGRYADGDGLYLVVKETGGKSWVLRYVFAGKRRDMRLGAYPALTLAKAREVASEARKLIASGIVPLTKRETDEAETRAKAKRIPHFCKMAEEVIKAKSSEWRNPKRRAQWEMTLREHAKLLANMPVNDITVADVLATLEPLWLKVPETASRLRGRIEAALDAAKVNGFRSGENPAAWRGNLAHLLAKPKQLSRGHHRALRFQDVPAFDNARQSVAGIPPAVTRLPPPEAAREPVQDRGRLSLDDDCAATDAVATQLHFPKDSGWAILPSIVSGWVGPRSG